MRPPLGLHVLIPIWWAILTTTNGVLGARSSSSSSSSSTITLAPGDNVCASKTINYITHTLPQQCLRTSWSESNSSITTTSTILVEGGTPTTTVTLETQLSASESAGQIQTSAPPASTSHIPESTAPSDTADNATARDQTKTEEDGGDLATGSFMSFEEWKNMMLKKSGQDPADIKARKNHNHQAAAAAAAGRGQEHGNLDSWGDDAEIALDFEVLNDKISGMTVTDSSSSSAPSQGTTRSGGTPDKGASEGLKEPAVYDDGVAKVPRPKDAGKTCKERFSFSSFDGGATVLKTSPGTKNSKAILVENKDSYMLFTCAKQNKFVIVELSEDILIDTVVLGNFEFFSSMVRTFKVSASDRYPVKMDKWKDLGTFQARNSRDIQPFLIEDPKIWAKYIRIEYLTHYGNEYYCPVSLLRVHGTRMLDSWKEAEGSQDDDDVDESGEVEVVSEIIVEAETVVEQSHVETVAETSTTQITHTVDMCPWHPVLFIGAAAETCETGVLTNLDSKTQAQAQLTTDNADQSSPSVAQLTPFENGHVASSAIVISTLASTASSSIPQGTAKSTASTGSSSSSSSSNISSSSVTETPTSATTPVSSTTTATAKASSDNPTNVKPITAISSTVIRPPSSSTPGATTTPVLKPAPNNKSKKSNNTTTTTVSGSAPHTPSSSSHHHQSPDSFFKSVSKRLTLLESNTTLSLAYIEDQSKFLQEALTKMEKRQFLRVDHFLDSLNNTVLSELRTVRQQYDQIWQSTVLALESQREVSAREILALSSRVGLLADEVVFQKRMAILQSVLLLGCLALVIFSRNGGMSLVAPGGGSGHASSFSASNFFGGGGGGSGTPNDRGSWTPPPSLGSPPWKRGSRYFTSAPSPIPNGHDSTASSPQRPLTRDSATDAGRDGDISLSSPPTTTTSSSISGGVVVIQTHRTDPHAGRKRRTEGGRYSSSLARAASYPGSGDGASCDKVLPATPTTTAEYGYTLESDGTPSSISSGRSGVTERGGDQRAGLSTTTTTTTTTPPVMPSIEVYSGSAVEDDDGHIIPGQEDGRMDEMRRDASVAPSTADTVVASIHSDEVSACLETRKPLPLLPEDPT